jgi:hypothetical protein
MQREGGIDLPFPAITALPAMTALQLTALVAHSIR